MKRAVILAILAGFIFSCGSDKPTDSNHGITVSILPYRAVVDLGATYHFISRVDGASNQIVYWSMEGDTSAGRIDSLGNYLAPMSTPVGIDSVRITARAQVDETKTARAWAVLVDPAKIYVSVNGSDTTGLGTRWRPYRSISQGLYRARVNQMVLVGAGQYDIASGETFPLRVLGGITVQGAGRDSTFVVGPGGTDPLRDAIFEINGDAITVEKLNISSSNSMGIGVWIRPGRYVKLSHNQISQNYIGVYSSGKFIPPALIESNHITEDSIGIVTADSSGLIIRNSNIFNCYKYGIEIRDFSSPNLGMNDSTAAGNDTIQNCGNGNVYLIYNGSPDTVWAIGNTWIYPVPEYNDIYIYDDDESGMASGPVILREP